MSSSEIFASPRDSNDFSEVDDINQSRALGTDVSFVSENRSSLWEEPGDHQEIEPEFFPQENMRYLILYNLFLALLCAPAGFALVGNN
jgi:hypothetical protein